MVLTPYQANWGGGGGGQWDTVGYILYISYFKGQLKEVEANTRSIIEEMTDRLMPNDNEGLRLAYTVLSIIPIF